MADKKPGCSLHIRLEVRDENGQVISDFPSGGQYGYDRITANKAAFEIAEAIGGVIGGWKDSSSNVKAVPGK